MVCIRAKWKKKSKFKKSAMLTVEASLLIPMAVMAAGIMISLSIFVYQRCWLTQAGCETVLAGSTQGILKERSGTEKAKERWNVLEKECYPYPKEFSSSVEGSTERVQMKIAGSTPVWGRKEFHMEIAVSQKIVRPVKFIRKVAALKE